MLSSLAATARFQSLICRAVALTRLPTVCPRTDRMPADPTCSLNGPENPTAQFPRAGGGLTRIRPGHDNPGLLSTAAHRTRKGGRLAQSANATAERELKLALRRKGWREYAINWELYFMALLPVIWLIVFMYHPAPRTAHLCALPTAHQRVRSGDRGPHPCVRADAGAARRDRYRPATAAVLPDAPGTACGEWTTAHHASPSHALVRHRPDPHSRHRRRYRAGAVQRTWVRSVAFSERLTVRFLAEPLSAEQDHRRPVGGRSGAAKRRPRRQPRGTIWQLRMAHRKPCTAASRALW